MWVIGLHRSMAGSRESARLNCQDGRNIRVCCERRAACNRLIADANACAIEALGGFLPEETSRHCINLCDRLKNGDGPAIIENIKAPGPLVRAPFRFGYDR